MKEKFSGLGAGEAATGPVRPSSECATSCSSFEWIRARFAGTTTAFDARFGGADGAGASAWTLAANAATGGAARGTTTGGATTGGAGGTKHSGGRATTGGAIEVEGKENNTADTARAATGAAEELAITGRAFEATMLGT